MDERKFNRIGKIIKSAVCLAVAFVLAFIPSASFFATEAKAAGKWISAWATSLVDGSIELGSIIPNVAVQDVIPSKSTIRIELTVTAAGSALRFKFSNQFGDAAITINEASVAKTLKAGEASIMSGTSKAITFNGGSASVTINPGCDIWSDTVNIKTEALEKLSVSLYFRNLTYIKTTGLASGRTFLSSGLLTSSSKASKVNSAKLSSPQEINISSGTITYHTIPFLSCVDTLSNDSNACSAVFIGDSTLVNDTYLYYAKKVVSGGYTGIGIVNEAIVGNKILSDGAGLIGNLYGKALIDRFDRDVLNMSGVKYCFVKIGLNDILHKYSKSLSSSTPDVSVDDVINGYKQLITKCHNKGIKIYFFSNTAYKGYEREFLGQAGDLTWNQSMQDETDKIDEWIRTNNLADGYIDCSPLSDPSDTDKLCSTFTPDGAHLTDLGSIALADLIPVSFVGANENKCKTAATIANVDPYKEKKQIIADMNKPKTTASSDTNSNTKNNTGNNTNTKNNTNTNTNTNNGTNSNSDVVIVTVPVTEAVTSPDVTETETMTEEATTEESTEVPVYVYSGGEQVTGDSNSGNKSSEVKYNVIAGVGSIGTSGANVGFVLLFVTAVVASGVVVVITMNKKKIEE